VAKVKKSSEDVAELIEVLRENLPAIVAVELEEARSPHELGRVIVSGAEHERIVVVLYRSGTALVQGRGDATEVASMCRFMEWKCSS